MAIFNTSPSTISGLEVLDRDAQVGMEELLEEELEKWLDPDRGIGYIEEAPVTIKKNSNRNYDDLNLLNNFFG